MISHTKQYDLMVFFELWFLWDFSFPLCGKQCCLLPKKSIALLKQFRKPCGAWSVSKGLSVSCLQTMQEQFSTWFASLWGCTFINNLPDFREKRRKGATENLELLPTCSLACSWSWGELLQNWISVTLTSFVPLSFVWLVWPFCSLQLSHKSRFWS